MARPEFHRTEEFPAVEWRDACVVDRNVPGSWASEERRAEHAGGWPDDAREHVVRRMREQPAREPLFVALSGEWDEDEFDELADVWRQETAGAPFLITRVTHWAYQRIIGMGPKALPLILRELQRETNHWLWALNAITGEDPADGAETFEDAAGRWLQWGRIRGLLS